METTIAVVGAGAMGSAGSRALAAGLYERVAADVAGANEERAILDAFFPR